MALRRDLGREGAKFVNPPLSESASFFTSLTRCLPSVGSAPLTDAALPKWEFDGCAQFDAASSLEFVDVVIFAESNFCSSFRRENVSARLSVFWSSKVPFSHGSSLSSVAFSSEWGNSKCSQERSSLTVNLTSAAPFRCRRRSFSPEITQHIRREANFGLEAELK